VVDNSLPLVEPLGLCNISNSISILNNNNINDDLQSMVSSGSRALGGYSLCLLSNNNLTLPVVDSPQASQFSGAKRLRLYPLTPPNSASLPLAGPLDSSQLPLVNSSSPNCGRNRSLYLVWRKINYTLLLPNLTEGEYGC